MTADAPTAPAAAAVDAPVPSATVHRMLAAGLAEGLPEPLLAVVDPFSTRAQVRLTLATVADVHTWQAWFAAHGASPLVVHIAEDGGWRHHGVAGPWRGWQVLLAHVTRLADDEGGGQR
jgi:hypothetical protein